LSPGRKCRDGFDRPDLGSGLKYAIEKVDPMIPILCINISCITNVHMFKHKPTDQSKTRINGPELLIIYTVLWPMRTKGDGRASISLRTVDP
jgi:hypothetical protein